ncbi:nuclear transport factor 2 family protein [Solwaraspora sp. WMMD406]|uniref:nuclear transport factor 2 family protein n=1 Tax=Solwaraspora sp. WMMD406 TaxID=3016095 RepID=UPI0024173095|nr:nuclear transport factor 2 family protein [Solwaraspora sp. WMMD406]MDG4763975.1 nuclear transport factor 2 family protein [Solwaraspora sp. WMMD406]
MTEIQDFGRQLGGFLGGVFGNAAGGAGPVFQPDPQAEIEVRKLLADLQQAFAEGDIETILASLADDFTTYELGATDGSPLEITDPGVMREYLTTLFPGADETQNKSISATRVVATANMGFTLEGGDVVIARADGTFEHQPLNATAVAVRTADGWKWLHWHMSEAGARFRVNANGVRVDLATGAALPGPTD